MKRLIADNGGRPAKNNDLELYMQAFANMEGYLNEVNGGDAVILYGCEITGTSPNANISEGIIFFDGSLCVVQEFPNTTIPLNLSKNSADSDPREYFDGVTRNTLTTVKLLPYGSELSFDASIPRLSDFNPAKSEVADNAADIADNAADISINTAKIGGLNRKVIEIGIWDMDADESVFIAHGVDFTKIRNVSHVVRNDANDFYSMIIENWAAGSNIGMGIDSTNVILRRLPSGAYDNLDYNDTGGGYNRGWVTIEYID